MSALRAAVAHNMYKPIPTDGSKRPMQIQDAYFPFRPPHTGFIYFPPEYSDHIAVSLLLKYEEKSLTLAKDLQTKQTQPHIRQKSVTDFFSKSSSGGNGVVFPDSVPKKKKKE